MAPRLGFPTYKGPVSWQQLNPKCIQSATGARYERYKRSTTFAGARAAGMSKMDRYVDVHQGYVKKGRQFSDGELDSTVRGASAPVIALWQGEGASSDGGSSPHMATPRSELLVSSDGSSYAAPSAGLVPDTRIACVSDNAIACACSRCARDSIGFARCKKRYKDNLRVSRNLRRRLAYSAAVLDNFDPMAPRLLWRYQGSVTWQQLNERIVGTAAHARYERYKSSRTFAEAVAAGMLPQDRSVDVRRGYVEADWWWV
jgi:hypothetical protein